MTDEDEVGRDMDDIALIVFLSAAAGISIVGGSILVIVGAIFWAFS